MKKLFLLTLLAGLAALAPLAMPRTAAAVDQAVEPTAPSGYSAITWAKAPGIASFFKAPENGGAIDFLTRIDLARNQISFILATNTPLAADSGTTVAETGATSTAAADMGAYPNLSFQRLGAEMTKFLSSSTKFLWNAPFFNMKPGFSDLSMAVRYVSGTASVISGGSRSIPDMARSRRMLIINNRTHQATIGNFDAAVFLDASKGDLAIEGFAPTVPMSDDASAAAARLFLGVSADGKELAVYCSRLATVEEASNALALAGIPAESQLQLDGGGSASCGYNLPGQYLVEPIRSLPLMMGAQTIPVRTAVVAKLSNIRRGPGLDYGVIRQVVTGATVQIHEEKNGWYRIGVGEWIYKAQVK